MLERTMKYSLHWTDINRFKGKITEMLVRRYIEKVLVSVLREEGWDQIIFTPNAWFGDGIEQDPDKPIGVNFFWNYEQKFFISNGVCPTKEFLKSFKKLACLLENTTDGFLVKMKKTKQTRKLKDALKELGLKNSCLNIDHKDNELLPIVEGEIEIVEIKTGKAIIPAHQMISYRKVLDEKYALRFYHVNIISFEKNEFEIEEKLITTPEELEAVQVQERKRGRTTKNSH